MMLHVPFSLVQDRPFVFAQDRLILPGSQFQNEPFDMPVERFLASLRFENKAKLDDLGLGIDINTLKLSD